MLQKTASAAAMIAAMYRRYIHISTLRSRPHAEASAGTVGAAVTALFRHWRTLRQLLRGRQTLFSARFSRDLLTLDAFSGTVLRSCSRGLSTGCKNSLRKEGESCCMQHRVERGVSKHLRARQAGESVSPPCACTLPAISSTKVHSPTSVELSRSHPRTRQRKEKKGSEFPACLLQTRSVQGSCVVACGLEAWSARYRDRRYHAVRRYRRANRDRRCGWKRPQWCGAVEPGVAFFLTSCGHACGPLRDR